MVRKASPTTGTSVAKPKTTAVVNWEDQLAELAKEGVEQEASVSTGQFIGTRGGQLSFNGSPIEGNKLKAIIVDSILENAYYEGDFDPDDPAPPVCYAFGRNDKELKPHPDAPEKQSESCAGCKWNEFKTAERGKGKACKNIRRLALIPASELNTEAIQKSELAFLKTPVTSVKGWAAYVRTLEALQHRPPLAVVTEISTVADPKTQFKVIFKMEELLENDLIPAVLDRRAEVKEQIEFPYAPPNSEAPEPKNKKPAARGRKY